jgi:hypothetical protein
VDLLRHRLGVLDRALAFGARHVAHFRVEVGVLEQRLEVVPLSVLGAPRLDGADDGIELGELARQRGGAG